MKLQVLFGVFCRQSDSDSAKLIFRFVFLNLIVPITQVFVSSLGSFNDIVYLLKPFVMIKQKSEEKCHC